MLSFVLLLAEAAELGLAWRFVAGWRDAGMPWLAALAAVALLAFGWRALLVLATFRLAGLGWPSARLWLVESAAFSRAYLAMTIEPLLSSVDRLRSASSPRAPADKASLPVDPDSGLPRLVFVHGWCCNCAVWRPVLRAWRRAGGAAPTVVTLAPVLGDIDRMARHLDRCLLAGRGASGPIFIVAHSMGGLVARRWLQQRGTADITGLLTVGTPHAGTRLARWGPGQAARQMRPGSSWLQRLECSSDARQRPAGAPLTCVWSAVDNFVAPAGSARRPGAASIEMVGVGHFGMLRSTALLDALQRALPIAPVPAATAAGSA